MTHFPSNVELLSTQRYMDEGKSSNNYANFNLALHVSDYPDRVLENREILKAHYDLPSEPVWMNQSHSSKCVDAASMHPYEFADASFTSRAGIVCGILTADCLPVFISNKDGTMVGIGGDTIYEITEGTPEDDSTIDESNMI